MKLSHKSCFIKHAVSTLADESFLLTFPSPKLHVTSPAVEISFALNFNKNINHGSIFVLILFVESVSVFTVFR